MKHGPGRFLATLGATLVALGASTVLASPALANEITIGDLKFTSKEGTIYVAGDTENPAPADATVIDADADQVSVNGGNVAIDVTQVEPAEGANPVAQLTIGSAENPYDATITLSGIDADLNVNVAGDASALAVVIEDCDLTGVAGGEATIDVGPETASTFTLQLADSTIRGRAGSASDGAASPDGGAAIAMEGEGTLQTRGDVNVLGGLGASGSTPGDGGAGVVMPGPDAAEINPVESSLTVKGGNAGSAPDGTTGLGGNGVNAVHATLVMDDDSTLDSVAGDGIPADSEETPVGLTVGVLDLSNGTGADGHGPTVVAVGYPKASSVNLNLGGVEAGSPEDDTLYPWVLQASTDDANPGADPFVVDYAGSSNEDPSIERNGWRWFSIAPHEITGVGLVVHTVDDVSVESVLPVAGTPQPGDESVYHFAYAPYFDGLDGVQFPDDLYLAVPEMVSVDPDVLVAPGDVEDEFYVPVEDAGVVVTAQCEPVDLPSSLTELYPDLAAANSIEVPVLQPVYRLYNPENGAHLLTSGLNEVDVLTSTTAWTLESEAPSFYMGPEGVGTPVYRLLNPNNGDHMYTTAVSEYDGLERIGWVKEGVGFYGVAETTAGAHPIYRLWNSLQTAYEGLGSHLWTPDRHEYDVLPTYRPVGTWKQEGVAWYAAYYRPATD